MYETLIKYINSYISIPLTLRETEMIKNSFAPRKLRKRQYFLHEGEICKYGGFIVKGAMRQYTVDEKGTEHIVKLTIENWWVSDRESFVMLTPTVYNIDALEDTEVLVITKADYLELINSVPGIVEMSRILDERNYIAMQKRLNASISMTAEKRYTEFAKTHPEFLKRFPQHMIASYLGITKETLSRIRNSTAKK
jgi:CRP-like cAMP-binding protein